MDPLDSSKLLWSHQGATYFRYPKLSLDPKVVHGVFTRLGGISASPFDSLNTSYSVGDHPKKVNANLTKIKEVMGADRLLYMNQCHGHEVVVRHEGEPYEPGEIPQADALVTNQPGLALMVKQADCQSIIIFDKTLGVVANLHCGWRGNVQNLPARVVSRMTKEFGCGATDLLAAIGPSLGPCCAEFKGHWDIFPEHFKAFEVRKDYFDLWALSTRQLLDAGLKKENIEVAGICTRCRTDLFFSYRGEGETGRFATVAMVA